MFGTGSSCNGGFLRMKDEPKTNKTVQRWFVSRGKERARTLGGLGEQKEGDKARFMLVPHWRKGYSLKSVEAGEASECLWWKPGNTSHLREGR